MKIAVCICTYRRPRGLANLLTHLQTLDTSDDIFIVVADNDFDRKEGLKTAESFIPDSRWPIYAEAVKDQGISFSRNTASRLALAHNPDLVAFIDDDEWPEPHWLAELVRIQSAHNADAVGGPTRPAFSDEVMQQTRDNPYFGADLDLPDGSPCQLEAAGNFLIKASTLREAGPLFFHPDFALSGGEDLAFFTLLQQKQATMHWAAQATVWETVPEDRLTSSWMRKRVMLIANSRVHVMRLLQPGLQAAAIRGLKTVALFCQAALYSIAGILNSDTADQARILRWKFWGKLTAHLSIKPVRIEGR